ncbi:N-6 DNA methylase [uncultured Pedobacter sp.]|uniref:HsdM family class I SAM-dependent methyltransferase n=1 Tax=uncultured Pedobacter sp. TaxID=246139 RepID=UPI0025DC8535|nr:N-6 DNA methylase [uncultured Pedobacter sp.]
MSVDRKKELGAFYTPNLVTDALCTWAIENKEDILLEPSFGGCNFLTSSIEVLSSLGCKNPYDSIFGYDIDSEAFKILKDKGIPDNNFFLKDFLSAGTSEKRKTATTILGNPPYLPIQKLTEEYRVSVLRSINFRDFKIDKKSSLWLYFIVHSLNFLKKDGKMAWIVPDSISFTVYGKLFLQELSRFFGKVTLLRIKERFFYESGTYEKTSILLCEKFDRPAKGFEIFNYNNLSSALDDIRKNKFSNQNEHQLEKILTSQKFDLVTLGQVFDIRIGIVLGATKLLIMKTADAKLSPLFPDFVYPILSKGKHLQNISINPERLLEIKQASAYLINGLKLEQVNPDLYIRTLAKLPKEVLENETFKKRTHPFGYDDFKHPDAFLTYFAQKLPKLVENKSKLLNCTNSVHRLFLKPIYQHRKDIVKFIALQTWCNFLKEETETLAREYGNSILKYEPSDAAKIPAFIPKNENETFKLELEKVFYQVQELIDQDMITEAHSLCRNFLVEVIHELNYTESLAS